MQQVRIVVRLEDEQVEVSELASNTVGHPAEVGGDGGATAAGLQAEAERLAAVMRNGERLDVHLTYRVGLAGLDRPGQRHILEPECAERPARGIDRDAVRFRQIPRRAAVVAVGVGEQDA